MQPTITPMTILAAEGDANDRVTLKQAFTESNLQNPLHFAKDGVKLLQYLRRQGDYASLKDQPLPGIILLNPQLPKLNAGTALSKIRQDLRLCRIPVIIMITSKAEENIFRSHDIDADSFIKKPISLDGLLDAVSSTTNCWFGMKDPVPSVQPDAA